MTKYVIITPARDEEAYIEKAILSVVAQTIRPAQWIIVDDGSRDRMRYGRFRPSLVSLDQAAASLEPGISPGRWRSNRHLLRRVWEVDSPDWEFIVSWTPT